MTIFSVCKSGVDKEVACLYSGTCIYGSPLGHNQLAVIQRWSAYIVDSGHGCYTEVVCLYSR